MEEIYNFIVSNWVAWLFALLGALIGRLYTKVIDMRKRTTAIEDGIRALLRNDIIKAYNKCQERGFCPIYEMENIDEMYKQYHALGGNGTITELVERIKEFPTQPIERHENHTECLEHFNHDECPIDCHHYNHLGKY